MNTFEEIEKKCLAVSVLLKKNKWIMTAAESCTGGGLCYFLTQIPGSSAWLDRGFVTYSNQSKIDLLGVKATTIETKGAVSEETAKEMAEGALRHSLAHLSIGITGIAGPEGETPDKPLGLVWIALATLDRPTQTDSFSFQGNRSAVRLQAINKALQIILEKN